MVKISKTARASAVQMLQEERPKLTTEQVIQEIRNLRAGKLSVLDMGYLDVLLAEHDRLFGELANAHVEIKEQADAILTLQEERDGSLMAANSLADERRYLDRQVAGALELLNQHLSGRTYDTLDDALRNLLQAYVTNRDNYQDVERRIREYLEGFTDIPLAEGVDPVDFILASHAALRHDLSLATQEFTQRLTDSSQLTEVREVLETKEDVEPLPPVD